MRIREGKTDIALRYDKVPQVTATQETVQNRVEDGIDSPPYRRDVADAEVEERVDD